MDIHELFVQYNLYLLLQVFTPHQKKTSLTFLLLTENILIHEASHKWIYINFLYSTVHAFSNPWQVLHHINKTSLTFDFWPKLFWFIASRPLHTKFSTPAGKHQHHQTSIRHGHLDLGEQPTKSSWGRRPYSTPRIDSLDVFTRTSFELNLGMLENLWHSNLNISSKKKAATNKLEWEISKYITTIPFKDLVSHATCFFLIPGLSAILSWSNLCVWFQICRNFLKSLFSCPDWKMLKQGRLQPLQNFPRAALQWISRTSLWRGVGPRGWSFLRFRLFRKPSSRKSAAWSLDDSVSSSMGLKREEALPLGQCRLMPWISFLAGASFSESVNSSTDPSAALTMPLIFLLTNHLSLHDVTYTVASNCISRKKGQHSQCHRKSKIYIEM